MQASSDPQLMQASTDPQNAPDASPPMAWLDCLAGTPTWGQLRAQLVPMLSKVLLREVNLAEWGCPRSGCLPTCVVCVWGGCPYMCGMCVWGMSRWANQARGSKVASA